MSRQAAVADYFKDPIDIQTSSSSKSCRITLTEREIENMGIKRVQRYHYKFKQQEHSHTTIPQTLFRRHNGIRLLILHGVTLITVAIVLGLLTHSVGFTAPYQVGDKSATFEVPTDVQGLFYVYARIDDFYPGHRTYGLSTPTGDKCFGVTQIEDVYKIRPRESVPELADMDPSAELYPCGRQSAMYFNDFFHLEANRACDIEYELGVPENCRIQNISISTRRTAATERFCLYTSHWAKHSQHSTDWVNTPANPRAQAWFDPPLVSPLVFQLGKIRDLMLDRGNYTFVFQQNVWPASRFGAKKMLYVVTFGPLGVRQTALIRIAALFGNILIIEALIFLVGVRKNWVMTKLPSDPELNEQWVDLLQDWATLRSKRGLGPLVLNSQGV